MQTRLARNSQTSSCFCLLSSENEGVCHHAQFFFPFKYLFLSSMYVFCLHVCIYMHVYLVSAYTRRRFPGSAVADGCEPPCGFWELSSGPSQEQVVLTAERSLQPQFSPSTTWATGIKLGPSGLPASSSTSAPSHLSS